MYIVTSMPLEQLSEGSGGIERRRDMVIMVRWFQHRCFVSLFEQSLLSTTLPTAAQTTSCAQGSAAHRGCAVSSAFSEKTECVCYDLLRLFVLCVECSLQLAKSMISSASPAGREWRYELDHPGQVLGVCRAKSHLHGCWRVPCIHLAEVLCSTTCCSNGQSSARPEVIP